MPHLLYKIIKRRLDFKFEAATSRGVLHHKYTWFLVVWEQENPDVVGIGECSPLKGLSIDFHESYESTLKSICDPVLTSIKQLPVNSQIEAISNKISIQYPSIAFGVEVALLDLIHGGKRRILKNDFYDKGTPISINGLVWMGEKEMMLQQIEDKIRAGFDCIKIKVGAIKFEDEMEVISYIRKRYPSDKITIRLDANGAFTANNVMTILKGYADLGIHSIEQPVKPGQIDLMKKICRDSPIPIALDEELIGVHQRKELLRKIQPQYIILKPSLLGGMAATGKWVGEAEELNIGWWMTSLLESNIGLNAIAQFTSSLKTTIPQGLGTGQLYTNNIPSPLEIEKGKLLYVKNQKWELKNNLMT